VETIGPERGAAIASTAIASSGKAKKIGYVGGNDTALNEIDSPRFSKISPPRSAVVVEEVSPRS
jgi:hypothetical protein